MTFWSALEMLESPAAKIAQHGLNWPSAGHGAVRIKTRTRSHTRSL